VSIVKLRIVSKGTGKTTQILLDGGCGRELEPVTKISWGLDFNNDFAEIPRATLEMVMLEADLECEADVFVTVLPNGKRYKLVEVDDG
jgi:hypothetical protein